MHLSCSIRFEANGNHNHAAHPCIVSSRNGEDRDDEQLRLTSYLEDCKRKLVEAE